jgi:hypothetical protein
MTFSYLDPDLLQGIGRGGNGNDPGAGMGIPSNVLGQLAGGLGMGGNRAISGIGFGGGPQTGQHDVDFGALLSGPLSRLAEDQRANHAAQMSAAQQAAAAAQQAQQQWLSQFGANSQQQWDALNAQIAALQGQQGGTGAPAAGGGGMPSSGGGMGGIPGLGGGSSGGGMNWFNGAGQQVPAPRGSSANGSFAPPSVAQPRSQGAGNTVSVIGSLSGPNHGNVSRVIQPSTSRPAIGPQTPNYTPFLNQGSSPSAPKPASSGGSGVVRVQTPIPQRAPAQQVQPQKTLAVAPVKLLGVPGASGGTGGGAQPQKQYVAPAAPKVQTFTPTVTNQLNGQLAAQIKKKQI